MLLVFGTPGQLQSLVGQQRGRTIPLAAVSDPNGLRCEIFLFDHLVGADEQPPRHGEAERPGGLEVYHKLELVRLLNG